MALWGPPSWILRRDVIGAKVSPILLTHSNLSNLSNLSQVLFDFPINRYLDEHVYV